MPLTVPRQPSTRRGGRPRIAAGSCRYCSCTRTDRPISACVANVLKLLFKTAFRGRHCRRHLSSHAVSAGWTVMSCRRVDARSRWCECWHRPMKLALDWSRELWVVVRRWRMRTSLPRRRGCRWRSSWRSLWRARWHTVWPGHRGSGEAERAAGDPGRRRHVDHVGAPLRGGDLAD